MSDIIAKLMNIDRRILYWVLFIGLAVPYLRPIGLPISVSPTTQAAYDRIQGLKPGDTVVISMNMGVGSWSEIMPGLVASTKQILRNGANIIVIGNQVDVLMSWNKLKAGVPELSTVTYGERVLYLGYFTGGETAVSQIASDMRSVFPTDYDQRKPLSEFPLTQRVNKATDVQLVITCDSGDGGAYFIKQWGVMYNVPVVEIGIGVLGSELIAYYNAGSLKGLSVGARGGAELEKLTGIPGEATLTMDGINVSHLLVIAAVVAANLGYLATKKENGGPKLVPK